MKTIKVKCECNAIGAEKCKCLCATCKGVNASQSEPGENRCIECNSELPDSETGYC